MIFIVKNGFETSKDGWYLMTYKDNGEVCGVCKHEKQALNFEITETEKNLMVKKAKKKGFTIEPIEDSKSKKRGKK